MRDWVEGGCSEGLHITLCFGVTDHVARLGCIGEPEDQKVGIIL